MLLLQVLLNEGTISPRHDSLVMDGSRSVLGCALSHLSIFDRIAARGGDVVSGDSELEDSVQSGTNSHDEDDGSEGTGGGWTLVLEDDFLLPPHFLTLLAHAWAALPRGRRTTGLIGRVMSDTDWDDCDDTDADLVYLGAGSNRKGPIEWLNRWVFRPAQTVCRTLLL